MLFSRFEDELEALRIREDFNSRFESIWNPLPEEDKSKVRSVQDYCAKNGIIANTFELAGIPANIL